MEVLAKVVIISLYVSVSNQYLVNNIICQLYLDNARKKNSKNKIPFTQLFFGNSDSIEMEQPTL